MSNVETQKLIHCAQQVHQAIIDHEAEIEKLDRAIGDGDHYINLRRGSDAIIAMHDELKEMGPDEALKAIGKKLLSTIGGASGPLISGFFLEMSKTEGAAGSWDSKTFATMILNGVTSIQKRGKADVGDKTMLDVWIPVAQAFLDYANSGRTSEEILDHLPHVAEKGMQSTKDLLATKGRAAFLGERAIGHIDPGSKSSQVIIETVCRTLREAR